MSTPELVVSIASELLVTDPLIPFALSLAASLLSPRAFGTQIANAQAAWAGHFVLTQKRAEEAVAAGGAGVGSTATVKSKKDGDVAITWGQVAGKSKSEIDKWLSSTTTGEVFLYIRNTRAASKAFLTG